jgi:hypothetical protein
MSASTPEQLDGAPKSAQKRQEAPGAAAGELSGRQQRAILALLQEPTITRAARRAEVGASTLRTWLVDPAFLRVYRRTRSAIFEQSVGLLQKAAARAVRTLVDCLKMGNRISDRIRAATAILSLGSEGIQQWDTKQQLIELERVMKDVQAKQRGQRP